MDFLIELNAIATPLLLALLAVVGWKLHKSVDLRLQQQGRQTQELFTTYNTILEPFALLLMTQAAWEREGNQDKNKSEAAINKMLSADYRDAAFKLSLIANDDVSLAYNDLIQFFCSQDEQPASSDEKLRMVMERLGRLLLEIRKSMGHETTRLDNWQMLEWFMTDVRKLKGT